MDDSLTKIIKIKNNKRFSKVVIQGIYSDVKDEQSMCILFMNLFNHENDMFKCNAFIITEYHEGIKDDYAQIFHLSNLFEI